MDKRRKEVVFLATALVVLLLAVGLQLRSGSTPAPAAAKAPTAAAAQAAQPTAPAPAAATPVVVVAQVKPVGPASGRDPFSAPGSVASKPSRPGVRVASLPMPSFNFPPLRVNSVPPVTPVFGGMLTAQPVAPAANPQPNAATPASAPVSTEPRLVGLVSGEAPMAIIRQGERRYYPRVGDTVGDYQVQEISARRVVLSSTKGTLSLSLGGR